MTPNNKKDELIDTFIRDITQVGFMSKSEAWERMNEIYDLGVSEERARIKVVIKEVIQEERYSGASHALYQLLAIIKSLEK